MNFLPDTEILVSFSDLKRLFLHKKLKLKKIALWCAMIALFYLGTKNLSYTATATFKHSSARNEIPELKNLLKVATLGESESGAILLLQSKHLMREVVKELGLQLMVSENNFFSRALSNLKNNLFSEVGFSLKDPDHFVFRNVSFDEEKPVFFFLCFFDETNFEVFNAKKERIALGKLKEVTRLNNLEFTVEKIPLHLSAGKLYQINVEPWVLTVEKLLSKFEVKPTRQDKNVLRLTFSASDRFLAADVINRIVTSYQRYLKQENEQLSEMHLAFLEKRQDELFKKFDHALEEQSLYLKANLGDTEFKGLQQEMQMLAVPKQTYTSKLFDIELDLKRFEDKKTIDNLQDPSRHANLQNSFSSSKNDPLSAFDLNQQKKTLALHEEQQQDLQRGVAILNLEGSKFASKRGDSFSQQNKLTEQLNEAKALLACLEENHEIPQNLSLINDPKSLIKIWADQIVQTKSMLISAEESQKPELRKELSIQKNNLVEVLNHSIKALEAKQGHYYDNLIRRQSASSGLEGINLTTAQNLYLQYNNQLDEIHGTIRQLIFFRDQIDDSEFEISSLSSFLTDKVSQEMIQKASGLALLLRDEKNRSIKEYLRLKEELISQKKFIVHHIDETIELNKLRAELCEDKISTLQDIACDLIKTEKALIEEKLRELSQKMSDLPEKWRLENKLKFKSELSMGIIEGMSQLVESKNLNYHLFTVESKPIDRAITPLRPNPPHLILFSLLGAVLGSSGWIGVKISRGLSRGLPLTVDSFGLYKLNHAGAFSPFCTSALNDLTRNDLETLRHLNHFILAQKADAFSTSIAIIGGKVPNYSYNLAELLAMRGEKVLLIHCVFDGIISTHDTPGLCQYLSNSSLPLPIRRKDSYDFLPTGGSTRHAVELLSKGKFSELIANMKKEYSIVLVYSSASPSLSEAHFFLDQVDSIVVSTHDETIKDLSVYRKRTESKAEYPLIFVAYDPTFEQ